MTNLEADPRTTVDNERLTAAMRRVIARADRGRARRGLPPAQVLLQAPGFEFASGDRALRFHSASVAKTMTAALVLQHAERGDVDLDAPLTRVLPVEDWRGLFVVDGVDRARDVTVRMLLQQRSGALDYFEDRSDAPLPFTDLVVRAPDRFWAPAELLEFTREHQHPLTAPGRRFHYSSTGYVLLGRLVEELAGSDLGAQLHDRVLAPAGMDDSCLWLRTLPGGAPASIDSAQQPPIAPMIVGRDDISRATSLSCDWGGGGLVTTLDDLVRFTRAWTSGRVVSADSFGLMTRADDRFRPGIRYGMGVMQLRYDGFFPLLRGLPRPVGHLGLTGVHAFAAPEAGIHLAMNFHATGEMRRSFDVHIALMRMLVRALRGRGGRAALA